MHGVGARQGMDVVGAREFMDVVGAREVKAEVKAESSDACPRSNRNT
jgi:hypothetical protein